MAGIEFIASVVGIVGAGTRLSIAIFDFASSIGSAGRELQSVATEISGLCSVLKQLQTVLEHAHFRPSTTAVSEAQQIIDQCSKVFAEINEIVNGLRSVQGNDLFPSVDFVSKVKWTFSKKSKVLVLRSTLEACKSTLSVMLVTMLLAERVSQRRDSVAASAAEEQQDKAMTQSLVFAQQCAVEQLESYEDEVEREEKFGMQLPGISYAATRTNDQKRRRSRGRLVRMFSGLSIVTDLPTPSTTTPLQSKRSDRASIWLDNILAPPGDVPDPHPGKHRQKRLSSVGTANAPQQLLRKWTDQGDHFDHRLKHSPMSHDLGTNELWQDSRFSFSGSKLPIVNENIPQHLQENSNALLSRTSTDLISPKTARVQSIGFHVVVGVDGTLESSNTSLLAEGREDSCAAIARAIMREHNASADLDKFSLCVAYGGKTKVLKASDKPLDVLKHYEELELDPRLFLRRLH